MCLPVFPVRKQIQGGSVPVNPAHLPENLWVQVVVFGVGLSAQVVGPCVLAPAMCWQVK